MYVCMVPHEMSKIVFEVKRDLPYSDTDDIIFFDSLPTLWRERA